MEECLYAVVVHGRGTAIRVFGPLGFADANDLRDKLGAEYSEGYYAEVRPMWDADDTDRVAAMAPRGGAW